MTQTKWAEELKAIVERERRAATELAAITQERDALFAAARADGLTYYRIAQITDMAESAVGKSARRARSADSSIQ
ncbi:MAG: hypothetical protein Q4F67_10475 [Propionibacteriaceae bacterium]|nr:hypothetical protein [Propionibacteriaceae bacterium]